jgi:putative ABC transport system substrate-binding protein
LAQPRLAAFIQALKVAGFIEGQNINIEIRQAEGHYERLPSLASEFLGRSATVIVGLDAPAALAAKAATKTIPIVFITGAGAVTLGLVDNLSRPGGNLTGVSILMTVLGPKYLELLRELLPGVGTILVLESELASWCT